MKSRRTFVTRVIALLIAGTGISHAGLITIGTPGQSLNCIPFTCANGSSMPAFARYQQIYSSDQFTAGLVTITGISFFSSSNGPVNGAVGTLNSGTFEFGLSTTQKPLDGLDTINPDTNLGSDFGHFTTVELLGNPAYNDGFTLTFSGTPFNYAPSSGNLLLDITISDASNTTESPVWTGGFDAVTDSGISRAYNWADRGNDSHGLATTFSLATVPVPAAAYLFASGILGLLTVARRRTKN